MSKYSLKTSTLHWSCGPIAIATSQFFYALSNVSAKYLYEEDLSVVQVMAIAGFFATAFNTPCAILSRKVDFRWDQLIAMGVLTAVMLAGYFVAFSFADVGGVVVIAGLAPIFAAPFTRCFKQSPPHWSYPYFSICALIGVTLITEPPFIFSTSKTTSQTLIGYAIAFVMTIGLGGQTVLQRSWQVNSVLVTFCNRSLTMISFSILGLAFDSFKPMSVNLWCINAVVGVCLAIGFNLIMWGMSNTNAVLAAVLILLQTPYAFILQFIILGTDVQWPTIIGVIITLLSVGGFSYFSARVSKPPDEIHVEIEDIIEKSYTGTDI